MNPNPFPTSATTVLLPHDPGRFDEFPDIDTLGELLTVLGHQCRHQCPQESISLEGFMCVIPRRRAPATAALVLLDVNQRSEPLIELFRVLRAVNNCTRLDRIRVLPAAGEC